ncbi:MAG: cell envelope protein SmpA [Rhodobacterales bacterium]|nr:MAG: cell envelope protein SmpA [Rhodobacterales bacterium]
MARASRMSKLIQVVKAGAVALTLVALGGCSAIYRNHGYVPTDSDLEQIVVGVDTRETVAEAIGRPTSFGMLQSGGWYYTQSRWRHFAYKAPKVIDRQIVAITYRKDGVVENIERFTLEDGRIIALSRRVTDSNIKGLSLLRQLMGNLGNLRATDVLRD